MKWFIIIGIIFFILFMYALLKTASEEERWLEENKWEGNDDVFKDNEGI